MAGGVKLRLCPFCGGDNIEIIKKSGIVATVRCQDCWADGPTKVLTDYIETEDCSDDAAWEEAKSKATKDAIEAWNRRPLPGLFYQDELERMEARCGKSS